MHVAVVGAGALGLVYATRLAACATQVSLVVRPSRVSTFTPPRIELVRSNEPLQLRSPCVVEAVPPSADVVLLCVRVEQLDEQLVSVLAQDCEAPVVSLTPLMPEDLRRLRATLGARLVVGMPGVAAYWKQPGLIRYWISRVSPTFIDQRGRAIPAVHDLRQALLAAGLRAQFKHRLDRVNPATTIVLFPLVLLLDLCDGRVDECLRDPERLRLTLDAVRECAVLSERMGPAAAFVPLLGQFLGPRRLRVATSLVRKVHPESIDFVASHFGRKTHAQNIVLSRQIIELACQEELSIQAFSKLFALLNPAD